MFQIIITACENRLYYLYHECTIIFRRSVNQRKQNSVCILRIRIQGVSPGLTRSDIPRNNNQIEFLFFFFLSPLGKGNFVNSI